MVGRILIFLLCVWCSLDAGRLLMVVTAQPTVSVMILTPWADRKEGGQVDMRCIASNLQSDHIVEWRTNNKTLRWGMSTVSANPRFMFTTTHPQTGTTIQNFTITDLQRDDTDEYLCNVNDPIPTGGHNIVATSRVSLSVYYFPSESFPMCSPAGPITVDTGTEVNMKCSSEIGNPAVVVMISSMKYDRYTWTTQTIDDTTVRSLDLRVDVTDDDVTFECNISSIYFPDMTRSCTIGPIMVRNMIEPVTELTTETLTTTSTSVIVKTFITPPPPTPSASISASITSSALNTAVIAGTVAGGAAALLLIIILIVICRRRSFGNLDPKSQNSDPDTDPTNAEFTVDQTEHSQTRFNEYAGLDSIKDHFLNNNQHTTVQSLDQIAVVENPIAEPSASHSSTAPMRRADGTNPSVLYAKPHHKQTGNTHPNTRGQYPHHSYDATTEHSYDYPVFDSQQDAVWPSKDRPVSLKPMAKVKPNVSRQPKPYIKPKPEPTSNTLDITASQMSPPSQAPPEPPPIHTDAGTPSQEGTHLPPSEGTLYAQVSVPKRQSGHDNRNLDPRSDDHIVYADLDLASDTFEDGGHKPTLEFEPVMYATVMRK